MELKAVHNRPVVHNRDDGTLQLDMPRATLAAVEMIEGFPMSGYVRQARRRARRNQRELAELVGTSQSTIARAEASDGTLTVAVLLRVLRAGGMHLAVVDGQGRWVPPLQEPPQTRDLAGRRFPSHLDLILDPRNGEWWGDKFGLLRPPETFHRDPRARREHRRKAHEWRGIATHGWWKTDWRDTTPPVGNTPEPGGNGTRWQTYEPPWRRGSGAAGCEDD